MNSKCSRYTISAQSAAGCQLVSDPHLITSGDAGQAVGNTVAATYRAGLWVSGLMLNI